MHAGWEERTEGVPGRLDVGEEAASSSLDPRDEFCSAEHRESFLPLWDPGSFSETAGSRSYSGK